MKLKLLILVTLAAASNASAYECNSVPATLGGGASSFKIESTSEVPERFKATIRVEKFDLKCPTIPAREYTAENLVCQKLPTHDGQFDCTESTAAQNGFVRHIRSEIKFDSKIGHEYRVTITEEFEGKERYVYSRTFPQADCRND